MNAGRIHGRRRTAGRMLAGTVLAAGLAAAASAPAHAATTATFSAGQLTVNGDSLDNTIAVSRDAAGKILVNGGAVAVIGGTPTVANTALIRVFGLNGDDVLSLSEVNGALPAATLFGGTGNDTLTGGSGADQLFGQGGNDTLLGKGGADLAFGGNENDTVTGGDADDQAFGQSGNDRMIWNPGDDTDLNEGGEGTDTVEVNGGNGAEQFTTTANGTRVRFDRLNPAPFSIDIGTSENLVLNANGGDDSFSATGNLATLIKLTVDGGANNDTILGSNGADILLGGDGNDFADGQQGNDVGFLGAGDDTFQWDPGDGSDVVEGQAGTDAMAFNGSAANERMEARANGGRVLFTRDVANIVMDLNDLETIDARLLGRRRRPHRRGPVRHRRHRRQGRPRAVRRRGRPRGRHRDHRRDQRRRRRDRDRLGRERPGPRQRRARHGVGRGPGRDRVAVRALAGDDVVDASSAAGGGRAAVRRRRRGRRRAARRRRATTSSSAAPATTC